MWYIHCIKRRFYTSWVYDELAFYITSAYLLDNWSCLKKFQTWSFFNFFTSFSYASQHPCCTQTTYTAIYWSNNSIFCVCDVFICFQLISWSLGSWFSLLIATPLTVLASVQRSFVTHLLSSLLLLLTQMNNWNTLKHFSERFLCQSTSCQYDCDDVNCIKIGLVSNNPFFHINFTFSFLGAYWCRFRCRSGHLGSWGYTYYLS